MNNIGKINLKKFSHRPVLCTGWIILGLCLNLVWPNDTYAGSSCNNSGTCSTSCNYSKSSNGLLTVSSTRAHSSPTCVINTQEKDNACFNSVPMSYSDGDALASHLNVAAESGTRSCNIGHSTSCTNGRRNHYGNDYGTAGLTGVNALAPATGRIIKCWYATGGGRAIQMEFDKKCTCSANNSGKKCNSKYQVIFFHLASWVINGTKYYDIPKGCARSIRKDEVIGIVGGSNYAPLKNNGYAIHLHMELWDGARTWTSSDQLVSSMCDDVQSFCGGCTDTSSCGKSGAQSLASSTDNPTNEVGDEIGTTDEGKQAEIAAAQEKCKAEQYLPDADTCYFCDMFKVLFNTGSVMAQKSYKALSAGLAKLIMAVFAIWISLVVLRNIASFEVKDPRKMLQEILQQAFRVLVVWVILQGSFFNVLQLTLAPVFNTGMKFMQALTNTTINTSASYMQNIVGYDGSISDSSSGGLPISMGQNLIGTIKSLENAVGYMMAYGREAICLSCEDPYAWLGFFPDIPMIITGAIIWCAGLILLLAFPWCLVDCVLNMAIAAGLAPAAVAAWAFKVTSSYLKKIWDFFMNAMFNFVFLGIVIYIILTALENLLNPLTSLNDNADLFSDPIEGLAYWGVFALKLIVICLLGWVFLDEGKDFAKKFASATGVAAGGGIGRKVGGVFAQAAKRPANLAMKGGKALGQGIAQMGGHFIGSPIRRRFNQFRVNRTKNKGQAIKDANGNIVGYERTRRNILTGFKRVTSRVEVDANGKETWSRSKQSWSKDLHNAAIRWTNKRRLNKLQKSGKALYNEKGEVIGYTRTARPWYYLGRKVTLSATKTASGEFAFSKEITSWRMQALSAITKNGSALNKFAQQNIIAKHKDLTENKAGKTFSSDVMMSRRIETDKYGNKVKEEFKFNKKVITKYLVNKDGTINMKMVRNMVANTTFNEEDLYTALALHVSQLRGIGLSSNFRSRKAVFQNGALVLEQQNLDGTITNLSMTFGGNKKDQMLLDIKTTDKKGGYTRTLDNGIMKKKVVYKHGEEYAAVSYKFADHYYQNSAKQPLSKNGEFGPQVDSQSAMFGFNQTDLEIHITQLQTNKMQAIDPKTGGQQINFVMPNQQMSTSGRVSRGGSGGTTAGGPTAGGSTAGGSTAGGPTAGGPTSGGPTAGGPTSGGPTSGGPTSGGPTSGGPTSGGPTSGGPTSGGPTSGGPTSGSPTSGGPTSGSPTSGGPTSGGPTSGSPTSGGHVQTPNAQQTSLQSGQTSRQQAGNRFEAPVNRENQNRTPFVSDSGIGTGEVTSRQPETSTTDQTTDARRPDREFTAPVNQTTDNGRTTEGTPRMPDSSRRTERAQTTEPNDTPTTDHLGTVAPSSAGNRFEASRHTEPTDTTDMSSDDRQTFNERVAQSDQENEQAMREQIEREKREKARDLARARAQQQQEDKEQAERSAQEEKEKMDDLRAMRAEEKQRKEEIEREAQARAEEEARKAEEKAEEEARKAQAKAEEEAREAQAKAEEEARKAEEQAQKEALEKAEREARESEELAKQLEAELQKRQDEVSENEDLARQTEETAHDSQENIETDQSDLDQARNTATSAQAEAEENDRFTDDLLKNGDLSVEEEDRLLNNNLNTQDVAEQTQRDVVAQEHDLAEDQNRAMNAELEHQRANKAYDDAKVAAKQAEADAKEAVRRAEREKTEEQARKKAYQERIRAGQERRAKASKPEGMPDRKFDRQAILKDVFKTVTKKRRRKPKK